MSPFLSMFSMVIHTYDCLFYCVSLVDLARHVHHVIANNN